jgi:hypothetical protein
LINTVKFNFPVFKNPNSLRPICKGYGPRCPDALPWSGPQAVQFITRFYFWREISFLRTKIKTFKKPKIPYLKHQTLKSQILHFSPLNIDKYHHADKQRRARNADSETRIC